MATKFSRMVTWALINNVTKHRKLAYREELPPINSHKLSNMWSGKVTCQIKNIKSLMTSNKRSLPLKAHDHLTIWPTYSHLTTSKKPYHLTNVWRLTTSNNCISWPVNFEVWWLQGRGLKRKRLSFHKLLVVIANVFFLSKYFFLRFRTHGFLWL